MPRVEELDANKKKREGAMGNVVADFVITNEAICPPVQKSRKGGIENKTLQKTQLRKDTLFLQPNDSKKGEEKRHVLRFFLCAISPAIVFYCILW